MDGVEFVGDDEYGLENNKGLWVGTQDGLEDGFGLVVNLSQGREIGEIEDGLKGVNDEELNTVLNLGIEDSRERERERRRRRDTRDY